MLKFYRRIKRKLIDDGNLKKYLIYAVGEILLVVIGILIALQINNWNEWKKERVREHEILIVLAENLETNIETLKKNIDYLHFLDRSSEAVLESIYQKHPYDDTLAYHYHYARVPKKELFLSQTGYEEYKNIGLQLLTNKVLKDEVLKLFEIIYPSILSDYKLVNGYYAPFDNHIVQNFIYTEDILEPIGYGKLLSDHFYISWIRAYKEGRKHLVKIEGDLLKETQIVLEMIKEELK